MKIINTVSGQQHCRFYPDVRSREHRHQRRDNRVLICEPTPTTLRAAQPHIYYVKLTCASSLSTRAPQEQLDGASAGRIGKDPAGFLLHSE